MTMLWLLVTAWSETPEKLTGKTLDPDHPLAVACGKALTERAQYDRCVRSGSQRAEGLAEVEACSRFTVEDHRFECIHTLDRRRYDAAPVITFCQDVMGVDKYGYGCWERLAEVAGSPLPALQACRSIGKELFNGCVARVQNVRWDATAVVASCGAFAEPLACLGPALRGATPTEAVVDACVAAHENDELRRECIGLAAGRSEHAAANVKACTALFEGKGRLGCLEKARENDGPIDLEACQALEKKGERSRCVMGR